jgi:hypothetical protein
MKLSYGQDYRRKLVSANQAVKLIKSGDWIDYGSMNGQVVSLDRALAARKDELKDIKVWNLLNSYPARILEVDPDGEVFTWNSWHLSARDRQLMKSGRPVFYSSIRYSELPRYVREHIEALDVAMLQVAPMDKHGFFNFGPQGSHSRAVCDRARVISIGDKPNGLNINERCGSTHIDYLKRAVLENKADVGIAYDGDADRCIAVDEYGQEVDGDHIMCITALDMHRRGLLHPREVVATVMSNIGLNIALRRENIAVSSCKVGDRYVLERMLQNGAIVGGEQSGHIIYLEHATSGDGLLTSLKLLEVMQRTGLPLSRLAAEMEKQPQLLVNIRLENTEKVMAHASVVEAIARAQQKLGEWGKLVVRPSGTEPLLRIMAQGPDQYLLQEVIDDIKGKVEELAEKFGSYV